MIERTMVAGNILDRLDALEAKLRDVLDNALTPQDAGQIPEQPDWSTLSGWVITGTELRDVYGRIVLDATVPSITIAPSGYMQSSDYVAATSGWQINGGTAEFNDVVVRGTIYATVGAIGGWTIDAGKIYMANAHLNSTGYISFGATPPTGYGNNVGAWLGYASGAKMSLYASSTNYFQWDGTKLLIKASNFELDSSGDITASGGTIGGWTIGAQALYAGSGAERVGLRPGDYPFYSGSETASAAPFRVTKAGVLFAQGATIQSAATGARVVLDGTGIKGYDATTQRYQISNDGSGWLGSSTIFSWTAAGVVSLNGSAVMPNTITGGKVNFFNVPVLDGLVLTNDSPTAGKVAWNSFTLTYQGTSYTIDAGNTINKWIWWNKATSTTVLQTGATPPTSANDQFIIAVNTSGTASHEIFANIIYADYISVVNLAAVSANMGALHIDGVLDIGASGGIYQGTGTFAAPTTGLKIWNDGGVGRIGGYNATVLQSYFGTDGKLYAGAGAVYLDADGLTVVSGADEDLNSVKWIYSGDVTARLYSYTGYLSIYQAETVAHQAAIELFAGPSSPHKASFYISSHNGMTACLDTDLSATQLYQWWKATGSGGGTVYTHLAQLDQAGTLRLLGGLYVGSLGTDPGADNVIVDGTATIAGIIRTNAGLQIIADGYAPYDHRRYSADTTGAQMLLRKARGTEAVPGAIVAGDFMFDFLCYGYETTTPGWKNAADLFARIPAGGTVSNTSMPGEWVFRTCADGSVTLTERLRIMSGGGISTNAGTNYWTFLGYTATAPAATGYVSVTINGTTYKLLAAT